MTWAIFREEHNAAILTLVQTGVPHATAVLGGGLLEETLTRTLSERLRNDPDGLDKLTNPGGPWASPFLRLTCSTCWELLIGKPETAFMVLLKCGTILRTTSMQLLTQQRKRWSMPLPN